MVGRRTDGHVASAPRERIWQIEFSSNFSAIYGPWMSQRQWLMTAICCWTIRISTGGAVFQQRNMCCTQYTFALTFLIFHISSVSVTRVVMMTGGHIPNDTIASFTQMCYAMCVWWRHEVVTTITYQASGDKLHHDLLVSLLPISLLAGPEVSHLKWTWASSLHSRRLREPNHSSVAVSRMFATNMFLSPFQLTQNHLLK